jgi:hypothetical protein
MAVNNWLRYELGTASVTDNLNGNYQNFIHDYGGDFSVIMGHIRFFAQRDRFDSRYSHITLFREPVDRAVSWLFYVLTNYEESHLPILHKDVQKFITTEGEELSEDLSPHIHNIYVNHFGDISENYSVEFCMTILKKYSVVGLYESMPRFLSDVADLIGIPRPLEIEKVNVTNQRPTVSEISPKLRQRLIELNSLDIELYQRVKAWKEEQWATEITPPPARTLVSLWSKYDLPAPKSLCSGEVLVSDPILNTNDVTQGQLLTFEVPFSVIRPISELEMGIHIFDANKKWAFGTNSTLLKQVQQNVETGNYRVFHRIIANLPVGNYTAGFAFAERTESGVNELYWTDVACEFCVNRVESQSSIGYAYFPATINLVRDSK